MACEVESVQYKVKIEWVQVMEPTDRDHLSFLKIFFNSMMRCLNFEAIGRKNFNSKKKQVIISLPFINPNLNYRCWKPTRSKSGLGLMPV